MQTIPFVKLFRSPNSAYFYDVNTNQIIPISKQSYAYLECLFSGKTTGEEPEEIANLKQEGYLNVNPVERLQHPYSDLLDVYLSRKMKGIILQVTQDCNMRCKYCIYSESTNQKQRNHSDKKMTFEMAKRAVEYLAANSIDSDNVNIAFYGGEPLLAFDLIQKVVLYAEKVFEGKELSFNMTTNATLLDDQKMDFLYWHKFELMLSIDGPRDIHNANRVFKDNGLGTYDAVINRLQWISQHYSDYLGHIYVNMVVDPQNDLDEINQIIEDCNMLSKRQFNISMLDVHYSGQKTKFSDEYNCKLDYQEFLAYFVYLNSARENLDELPLMSFSKVNQLHEDLQRKAGKIKLGTVTAPSGPCIPGQLRLFINADGEFYPCERVSELSPAMQIGSLDKGINLDAVAKLLNIAKITENDCKNCWASLFCIACARHADTGDELSGELRLQQCTSIKRSAVGKIQEMILMKEAEQFYN